MNLRREIHKKQSSSKKSEIYIYQFFFSLISHGDKPVLFVSQARWGLNVLSIAMFCDETEKKRYAQGQ